MSTPISYRASLKNLDVEEVIDLLVHRPLGYLVARLAYPTPVTPDAITVVSMLVGIAAGVAYAWGPVTGHSHHVLGGALLVTSAILDCSDGQLARMRKSSSRYGRMLDGMVDAVVQVAAVPVALFACMWRLGLTTPAALTWGVLGFVAILAGIRHTTLYDQFKNVYVRNTDPTPRDCDDLEDVESEWARARAERPLAWTDEFRFWMYKLHLTLVRQTMRWIDPHIPARFREMPAYSPDRAAKYRALEGGLMRAWSFYGIGTHIFFFAVCTMFDRLEWYIVLRLFVFNAALAVLVPMQRRASREFFGGESAGSNDDSAAVAA
jgi:phosphatidylglycerophosphate synthase